MSTERWFRIVILDEGDEEIYSFDTQYSEIRDSTMKNAVIFDIVEAIKEHRHDEG